jgi:hypothetical protein
MSSENYEENCTHCSGSFGSAFISVHIESMMLSATGCYYSMEGDGDRRCVEVTLAKRNTGGASPWVKVLEDDAASSSQAEVTKHVFLDVARDGEPLGRIAIGLFGEVAKKTCENFRALCTGEKVCHCLAARYMTMRGDVYCSQNIAGRQ